MNRNFFIWFRWTVVGSVDFCVFVHIYAPQCIVICSFCLCITTVIWFYVRFVCLHTRFVTHIVSANGQLVWFYFSVLSAIEFQSFDVRELRWSQYRLMWLRLRVPKRTTKIQTQLWATKKKKNTENENNYKPTTW